MQLMLTSGLFSWLPVLVWAIDSFVAVISDGWNVDAAITNMFVSAVGVGAAFGGMFVPFQAYGCFFG